MIPGRVSILIPARNERFLPQTVEDLLAKAGGDVEVLVCLDGYWPDPDGEHYRPLPDDPRVTLIHRGVSHGMREAINAAAALARGEYLLKCDAHVLMSEGYDVALKAECADDWVVVPRRLSLEPISWTVEVKEPKDAHFLSWPWWDPKVGDFGLHGLVWKERGRARRDVLLDEEMSSQGSFYFMTRKHWERKTGLGGGLRVDHYGDFIQEMQEVGCRTWLGGGALMVNKKVTYAHLHKGHRFGRGYSVSARSWVEGCRFSADYWCNNRWPDRVRDFEWLIDRFWPVPTWPENWRVELPRRLAEQQEKAS